MTAVIVVPARYGSTRFPGKPLHPIAGVSMLARVIAAARRAAEATGADVLVATDDERIMEHAADLGAACVMTDPRLASGTDRTREAVERAAPNARFVVNLQGDAPFTPPAHVRALLEADGAADVVTPVIRLSWPALDELRARKVATPFSGTTCIRAGDGRAIWFSKQIIPAIRDEAARRTRDLASPVFQHIGLYGYSRPALDRIAALPVSTYEEIEGLEQLRFLEAGLSIQAVEVDAPEIAMSGVDTLEDVARAEALIARHGDPFRS
ncbi:3-deoxy-manno-octulosonate cytidylyltransferase [bacterium]|nr:3-deoxy-manno-octulosonate cytidylyltransferase [bacterium]